MTIQSKSISNIFGLSIKVVIEVGMMLRTMGDESLIVSIGSFFHLGGFAHHLFDCWSKLKGNMPTQSIQWLVAIYEAKNAGPRITRSVFLKIMALALLEPVLDQNMYYLGMKITSATFTATMSNVIPAVTFLLAWILRLERVDLRAIRSVAKVAGTAASVSGAMVMTLYKGPIIGKGSSRIGNNHSSSAAPAQKDMVKGSIIIIVASSCWAAFIILQTITLREYPSELTLATMICLVGAAEGTVAALVMERGGVAAWSLGWNSKLFVIVFSAIICSGMAYCFQGSVMKDKGPVFVTTFSPLSMILVAMAGLLFLGEDIFLGGVIGSLLIVLGLYMVVWGKSRDPPLQNGDTDVELATDA